MQRFTPLLANAARFARHSPGDRWFVDETYVKVAGVWRYVHRAIDQHGQLIDILVSKRRDGEAARRFFLPTRADLAECATRRGGHGRGPRPPQVAAAFTKLAQAIRYRVQHGISATACRTGMWRSYWPSAASSSVIITGLAFLQNLRRGHHELATETIRPLRVAAAFAELAVAI